MLHKDAAKFPASTPIKATRASSTKVRIRPANHSIGAESAIERERPRGKPGRSNARTTAGVEVLIFTGLRPQTGALRGGLFRQALSFVFVSRAKRRLGGRGQPPLGRALFQLRNSVQAISSPALVGLGSLPASRPSQRRFTSAKKKLKGVDEKRVRVLNQCLVIGRHPKKTP